MNRSLPGFLPPWLMDYGTFFFTNIIAFTVFASTVTLLAWYNRRVTE